MSRDRSKRTDDGRTVSQFFGDAQENARKNNVLDHDAFVFT
jgi:hypothetical protein